MMFCNSYFLRAHNLSEILTYRIYMCPLGDRKIPSVSWGTVMVGSRACQQKKQLSPDPKVQEELCELGHVMERLRDKTRKGGKIFEWT